jgi:hypothetical protein
MGWMKKSNRGIRIAPALAACFLLLIPDVQKVRHTLKPEIDLTFDTC